MARSKLASMLELRCPRCREGAMFKHSALSPTRFDDMYTECPVCGLYYEPEVGFYYGAMYFSYGFSVALVAVVGLVLYLAGDPSIWVYVVAVAGVVVLLTPLSYRYSRMLMLHLFGHVTYNPDAARKPRG